MAEHDINTMLERCVWLESVPGKEHSGMAETVLGTGPSLQIGNRHGVRGEAVQRPPGRGQTRRRLRALWVRRVERSPSSWQRKMRQQRKGRHGGD